MAHSSLTKSYSSSKRDASSDTERIELNKSVDRIEHVSKKLKLDKDSKDSTDHDAIVEIFKELGVSEYHPQTVNQLIQFSRSHIADMLNDAYFFANTADPNCITIENLEVALELRNESRSISIPYNIPEERVKEINSIPLPTIKSKFDILHLPNQYLTLTNCNVRHVNKNELIEDNKENNASEVKNTEINEEAKSKMVVKKRLKNKKKKAVLETPLNNETEVPEFPPIKKRKKC